MCPRCQSTSLSVEGNHAECMSCGFSFNPSILSRFLNKFKKTEKPEKKEQCRHCYAEIVEETAELAPVYYGGEAFCSEWCRNIFIQREANNERQKKLF